MVGKLSIVLVLAVFVCCVQANLERFGDLGTGEQGYYKRCFLRSSFRNLIGNYYRYPLEKSIDQDNKELCTELDKDFSKFGGQERCSDECYDWVVDRELVPQTKEDKELNDSRCERFATFKRHCELAKQRLSRDLHKIMIEKWLCQTSQDLDKRLHKSFFVCQVDAKYPEFYHKKADLTFESVYSYSLEQLKEAQDKSNAEIEASEKLRAELDAKTTELIYSMADVGMEKLPKYMQCMKDEKKERKQEKKERRRQQLEELDSHGSSGHDHKDSDALAYALIFGMAAAR